MTDEMALQQRRSINHRIAAHQMRREGKSAESIAVYLDVTQRTVHRWLGLPCPSPLPVQEEEELDLASFYMQGACGSFPDLDWVSQSPLDQAEAKQICTYCPVLAKCRDYALNKGRDELGVWAAMTKSERRRESRRQRERRQPAVAQVREAS